MNDLDLDSEQVEEMRGLLTLILEGMQAVSSRIEIQLAEAVVGPSFAKLVFPFKGVPKAEENDSIERLKEIQDLEQQAQSLEKEIRSYTHHLGIGGVILVRALVREGKKMVLSFKLMPFDVLAAETRVKFVNQTFANATKRQET